MSVRKHRPDLCCLTSYHLLGLWIDTSKAKLTNLTMGLVDMFEVQKNAVAIQEVIK